MKKVSFILALLSVVFLILFILNLPKPKSTDTTFVDASPFQYDDFTQYQDYVNRYCTNRFVEWDKLKVLGQWESYLSYPGTSYTYSFTSSNIKLKIILQHDSEKWYDNYALTKIYPTLPMTENMDSMRDNLGNKRGRIVRHGIAYRYSKNGQLHCITWVENSVEYCIYGDEIELSDYPEDNSIIGRLLSSDNAVAKSALKELEAQQPFTRIHQPIPKDTLSVILAVASGLCLAAAVVLLVIGKRKSILKKKSAEEA